MAATAIEIESLSLERLRADASGALVQNLAALAYHAFRQPPWNDDLEPPRLHFGLGVDLMRRNAVLLAARDQTAGRWVGYTLGYEVFPSSVDPRDLTLDQLSGTPQLAAIFEPGKRIFYGDTLCVDAAYRGQQIGYRLASALIDSARDAGFTYRLGRTGRSAHAMRGLYQRLGFRELPVTDTAYPERSYWLLRL